MGFSYNYGANPAIDYPRLLIADTNPANYVFDDREILMANNLQALQFQSSMFYSGSAGQNLPTTPVSYLRVAAILLDSIAANKSKLSSVIQLLDVKLSVDKAAQALRAQAANYRQVDDDAGAFMVIEQCSTTPAFIDRFWKQIQRFQLQ